MISAHTMITVRSRDGRDVRKGMPIISKVVHIGRVWQITITPPELDHLGRGLTNRAKYQILTGPKPFKAGDPTRSQEYVFEDCLKLAHHVDTIALEGQSPITVTVADFFPGQDQHFAIFLETGRKDSELAGEKPEPEPAPAPPPEAPKSAPPAGGKAIKL